MKNLNETSRNEFKFYFENKNFKKILIISGKNSFRSSGAEKLIQEHSKQKKISFFFKTNKYPDLFELEKLISCIKSTLPDLIVAIGGGSVIDYAKIANVFVDSDNLQEKIENSDYKIRDKFTKLIAIPTTAGSGAEVTSNGVIYINKKKYSIENEKLLPDKFYLIPDLVKNANFTVKSSAGFDAIAQAIESLMSKKSNHESVIFAEKSLSLSFKYFVDFLKDSNYENTSAMCLSSNLAGQAINISKTTAPHAVSYPFTSIYGINHGHAVSLTLNQFLRFNYIHLNEAKCNFSLSGRFENLFRLSNTKDFVSFDKFLKNIKREANLEGDFKKLKIDIEKDFSNFVSGINALRLANNPVDIQIKDLKKIILNL